MQHMYKQLRFVVLGNFENLGAVSRMFLLEEQVQQTDSMIKMSIRWQEFCEAVDEAQKRHDTAASTCDDGGRQLWASKLEKLQKEKDSCRTELDKAREEEIRPKVQ